MLFRYDIVILGKYFTMEKEINLTLRFLHAYIIIVSLLTTLSLYFQIKGEYNSVEKFCKIEAESSFNKDLIYRKWAAMHGGVYVPVTENTQPNKYLKHIKNRDVVIDSVKYTLVNPAYMTRQVHEMAKFLYEAKGHITSLSPIRPENKADDWETKVLHEFENGTIEKSEIVRIGKEKHFRFMKVLKVDNSCLKCHANQGYKLNDIRGGISVSVPLKEYLNAANSQIQKTIFVHIIFLILTLVFGIMAYKIIKKEFIKRIKLYKEVLEREENIKTINEELKQKNEEYVKLNNEYLAINEEYATVNEEYKSQNEELNVSNQRLIVKDRLLELAQKLAQVGHWELDIENNNLTWSDEVYRIFDLEPQEFEATYDAFLQHIHPNDRDLVNNAYAESLKNKTKYEVEHRLLLKNNVIKYVIEKCTTEYDDEGKAVRSLGTIQDITHRKQYEREIIELNNRYNVAFSTNQDAIIIMDNQGNFVDFNDAFTKISGYKKEEVLGTKLKELKQFYDLETIAKIEQILKTEGKVENFKVHWINKLGEQKNGILSVQIVKINNREHYLSTIREIDNNLGALL